MDLNLDNISTISNVTISYWQFFVNLILTLITSYLLKYIYLYYGKSISNRDYFSEIFVPVSLTTMIIITIVKSSLALSLGLVGALSIVRFRTAIKEPEELAYIFICIAIGLGFGANQITITLIGTIFIFLVIIIIRKKKNNVDSRSVLILSLEDSKKTCDLNVITSLLQKHCESVELKRLEEENTFIQATFIIIIDSFDDLITIKNKLNEIDSNLKLSFMESNNIF